MQTNENIAIFPSYFAFESIKHISILLKYDNYIKYDIHICFCLYIHIQYTLKWSLSDWCFPLEKLSLNTNILLHKHYFIHKKISIASFLYWIITFYILFSILVLLFLTFFLELFKNFGVGEGGMRRGGRGQKCIILNIILSYEIKHMNNFYNFLKF